MSTTDAGSGQWPMEYVRDRNAAAWKMREKGETLEAIGGLMPRADGRGVGVTKARAWQVIRAEFKRRALLAGSPDEVERLFRSARLKSLAPLKAAALERFEE